MATQDKLERLISRCGEQMLASYTRYAATGCFADRGDADGWRLAMESAIRRRTAAAVAQLEQSRGVN
jgi:hypothetical protein